MNKQVSCIFRYLLVSLQTLAAISASAQSKEIEWLSHGAWIADSVCFQRVGRPGYDSCIHLDYNFNYYQFRLLSDSITIRGRTGIVMDITGMELDPESNTFIPKIENDDPTLYFDEKIDNGFKVGLHYIESMEHVELINFSENAFSMIHTVNGVMNRVHYRKTETPQFLK